MVIIIGSVEFMNETEIKKLNGIFFLNFPIRNSANLRVEIAKGF